MVPIQLKLAGFSEPNPAMQSDENKYNTNIGFSKFRYSKVKDWQPRDKPQKMLWNHSHASEPQIQYAKNIPKPLHCTTCSKAGACAAALRMKASMQKFTATEFEGEHLSKQPVKLESGANNVCLAVRLCQIHVAKLLVWQHQRTTSCRPLQHLVTNYFPTCDSCVGSRRRTAFFLFSQQCRGWCLGQFWPCSQFLMLQTCSNSPWAISSPIKLKDILCQTKDSRDMFTLSAATWHDSLCHIVIPIYSYSIMPLYYSISYWVVLSYLSYSHN